MRKTRLLGIVGGSLGAHIAEVAEEMGRDWPIPISREQSIPYGGRTIELYYEETGSLYAWKAFVSGIGTSSGIHADEALAKARARIDQAHQS